MSRPVYLVLGFLLLTIAGVMLLVRESAVNPEAASIVIGIFTVPGLTLLALGVLPPRRMPPQLAMSFKPMTLLAGLAITVSGVAVIALHHFVPVIPHVAMIAALLAVPGGLLVAGTSWSESCAKCREPFNARRVGFGADRETVRRAVESGSMMKILDAEPQPPSEHRVQLRIEFCPKCHKLAFLSGPGVARTMIVGDVVAQLMKRSGNRV